MIDVADLQPQLLEQFQAVLTQNRLSHAYLFSGDYGSFELAIYLAQSRFCEALSEQQLPCQTCRSCRLIAAGEFADVTVLEPSGQVIKTDEVRQLSKSFAQTGYEGACQVFIIREADRLHPNAANSLLKQIEEPTSPYYVFLLTRDDSKVLSTIRSRCQTYRLLPDRQRLVALFEAQGLLKRQAHVLAQLTDDPGQVESLAGDKALLELIRLVQGFCDQLRRDTDQAYLMVGQLVAVASDKRLQELGLQVATVLVSQDLNQVQSLAMLQKIGAIRAMWQANVSFQNCLDYLVLTL